MTLSDRASSRNQAFGYAQYFTDLISLQSMVFLRPNTLREARPSRESSCRTRKKDAARNAPRTAKAPNVATTRSVSPVVTGQPIHPETASGCRTEDSAREPKRRKHATPITSIV